MKLALILAVILLTASAVQAKDAPPARFGWVDSAKLDAGSTEIARGKTHDQTPQVRQQMMDHLRDACRKVKADKHLAMVTLDPLAADPADEVTAEVLKLWNAADEASVAAENARLTARVAQLEAAANAPGVTKPAPPTVPPAPPIQPKPAAKK